MNEAGLHLVDPRRPRGRSECRRGRLAWSRWPGAARGWGALQNWCPHQGGPLGEGSIENGGSLPVARV